MEWPNRRAILQTRSRCKNCQTELILIDIIPVFSFLLLGGKCRKCKAHIAQAHLFTELMAMLIALASVFVFSGWLQVVCALFGWTLLFGSLVDLRLRILPDGITIGLIIAGLIIISWIGGLEFFWLGLFGTIIGFGAFYLLAKLYQLLRGREGLGLGDAKLLAAGGAWLGPFALSWVVLLACFFAITSLLILRLVQQKPIKSDTALSFGPALSLAIFILWLWSGRDGVTIHLL